jgi:hypothetical protein
MKQKKLKRHLAIVAEQAKQNRDEIAERPSFAEYQHTLERAETINRHAALEQISNDLMGIPNESVTPLSVDYIQRPEVTREALARTYAGIIARNTGEAIETLISDPATEAEMAVLEIAFDSVNAVDDSLVAIETTVYYLPANIKKHIFLCALYCAQDRVNRLTAEYLPFESELN